MTVDNNIVLDDRAEFCKALAGWVASSPMQSNELARRRAQEAFIDTVGCMLAGCNDLATTKVLRASMALGSGDCHVFGHHERLPAAEAAMVNGTAAHALDFDDNFIPAVTHASAVLVPALIALGQEEAVPGALLLDAYIVGLEIQAQLGRLVNPSHYGAGWHATATIGAIGAAAACSRLIGLNQEQSLNAMSISTSMAGGSKKQFGTMAKPLHAGLAARAGITATRLAQHGVEANKQPFTGAWGFAELFADVNSDSRYDFKASTQLAILTDGLAVKRFPCCASAHRTLDSIESIMTQYQLSSLDIASIETIIPDTNFRNLRFKDPKNESEARFSMHYCAAVVAHQGSLSLEDFTALAIERPAIKDLMGKVSMIKSPEKSRSGESIWEKPAITTIKTNAGVEYSESTLLPVGTIYKPFNEEDVYRKFFDCGKRNVNNETLEYIYKKLKELEKVKDINSICI